MHFISEFLGVVILAFALTMATCSWFSSCQLDRFYELIPNGEVTPNEVGNEENHSDNP